MHTAGADTKTQQTESVMNGPNHLGFIYIFLNMHLPFIWKWKEWKKVRKRSKKCLWCNKNECNIINSRGIGSLSTTEIQSGWKIQVPVVDWFALVCGRWQGKPSIKPPWDRAGHRSAGPFCFPNQIEKFMHIHFFFERSNGKKIF